MEFVLVKGELETCSLQLTAIHIKTVIVATKILKSCIIYLKKTTKKIFNNN